MGEHETSETPDSEQQRDFVRALLDDLAALELMIEDDQIEEGVRRIGAEQEIFLVDEGCEPAPRAVAVLEHLNDPIFTTELASFNLEANLPPYEFEGNCLSRMEADLHLRRHGFNGATCLNWPFEWHGSSLARSRMTARTFGMQRLV